MYNSHVEHGKKLKCVVYAMHFEKNTYLEVK